MADKTNIVGDMGTFKGGIDNSPIGQTTPAAGKFTTIQNNGAHIEKKTDGGAADYNPSALTSDYIITVNTIAAARAVTISTEDRDTGSAANPRIFIIKDIAGNASANNITISLETSGNIDGAPTAVINTDDGSISLMIDGTNGYIF